MSPLPAPYVADANKQVNTVPMPYFSSIDDLSSQENPEMERFSAVLAQLKHENMASFVSSIRFSNENLDNEDSPPLTIAPSHGCRVLPKPLYGSYNLAYRIVFEDGAQWILKVPANGHHACFDRSAAEALALEAMTMKMIKQTTTIPIPTVHHFDASANNDIGCPYILMDFLRGKPVWQGWFDNEASISTREQFRARSLQTIAAAMVQLSQFKLDRSGSLSFDSDGRPTDVAAARVPDWLAEQDIMHGLANIAEGYPFCEKGPMTDPASSFLFMLNRRGIREKDGPYVRGINEIIPLFTTWLLETVERVNDSRGQFVLAHPDFAFQNFLVEDDGTLCGIIDWDGVAAVPLSVGCLKYPDWLMKDWHPKYDYRPENIGQDANSPQELATYRNMYAQFVEAQSSITCGSRKTGKLNADITRMSLVAGTLDLGAHDLKLTDVTLDIIFERLEALTAGDDDDDVSNADSLPGVAMKKDDVEEEGSNGDTAPTETEDTTPGDKEENNAERLCSKCVAEPTANQPPANDDVKKPYGKKYPTVHASCFEDLGQEHNVTSFSSGTHTEELIQKKKDSASRKARVARWALGLGEKGSRTLVKALHKSEAKELKSPRKVRMLRWALGLGEKGCRGASRAFHKHEEAFIQRSKDQPQALPVQNNSCLVPKKVKMAKGLCKRTEILLRKVTTRMHRDALPKNEASKNKQTETKKVLAFLKWLIAMLKKIVHKPTEDDMGCEQTSPAAENRFSAKFVLVSEEHCQRCNPGEENRGCEESDDTMRSTEVVSEDVWASIAAEIDKGGIPIDLIKKRRDAIAQYIIQDLGEEIQRERETVSKLKVKKAAKKAKRAQKQAAIPKTNDASSLEPTIAPEDPNSDIVNPYCKRPRNGECGPSEPESLLSKLEAAKRRFDVEIASEGKESESANPRLGVSGAVVAQFQDAELQKSAQDVVTLEDKFASNRLGHAKAKTLEEDITTVEGIRSPNPNLRAMPSSLQGPEAVNTDFLQNILHVPEGKSGESESNNHSQNLSFKSLSDASSTTITAQPRTTVKGGRWFETLGGNLMRIKDEDTFNDNLYDQQRISNHRSCVSEEDRRSSKNLVTDYGDKAAANKSHFGPIFPEHKRSESVNVFQVPNIDDEDEECDAAGRTKVDNDREDDELEDGEIDEGVMRSVDGNIIHEDKELRSEEVSEEEGLTSELDEGEIGDSGNFTTYEVCVALGNGNLDEQRMARLKEGFMALLDDAVGKYRRWSG